VVLTASIFGAFFGLPLLLLVGPPFWWELSRLRGRGPGPSLRAVWLLVAIGTTMVGSVIGAVAGANDVDTGVEVALAVVVVSWLAIGAAAFASSTTRLTR